MNPGLFYSVSFENTVMDDTENNGLSVEKAA